MIGVHMLDLQEGVTTEEFDAFVTGPFDKLWREPIGGIQARIEQGNRGEEKGRYAIIWEFDSVELRDTYFPDATTITQAFHNKVGSKISEVDDQLWKMAKSAEFTDFVVLFATPPSKGVDEPSLYGVHNITLKPDVTEEEFEAFVVGPYAEAWKKPIAGIGHIVIKGDRGKQNGAYKLVFRFSPASLRDKYVPEPTKLSEEFQTKVYPMLPHDVEDRLNAMIEKHGFTDFGPVTN